MLSLTASQSAPNVSTMDAQPAGASGRRMWPSARVLTCVTVWMSVDRLKKNLKFRPKKPPKPGFTLFPGASSLLAGEPSAHTIEGLAWANAQKFDMSCRDTRTTLLSITARASAAEKARFTTLARTTGISESRLALIAIRAFVGEDGRTQGPVHNPTAESIRATDRITIRLRPGDGAVIARRAAERDMKASTYLAAMARAHIATNPPLSANELAALKHSIIALSAVGTLLAQSARNPTLRGPGFEDVRQTLNRMHVAVAALEQRTHDFAKAALIAWESRFE